MRLPKWTQSSTQVWRHTWPPSSGGSSVRRTRTAVHSGFLASWTANGLHERVLQRIHTVLDNRECSRDCVKVRLLVWGLRILRVQG